MVAGKGGSRVVVLFGGQSAEHDVSIASGLNVLAALDKAGFRTLPVLIRRTGEWVALRQPLPANPKGGLPTDRLVLSRRMGRMLPEPGRASFQIVDAAGRGRRVAVDVLFPVLHGVGGEDGSVQGLCRLQKLPVVGSRLLGQAVSLDKVFMKTLFAQHGLAQARWLHFSRTEWETNARAVRRRVADLGYPCFVKPSAGGSSIGISKVNAARNFDAAVKTALAEDEVVVVEERIECRELECGILGYGALEASEVGEIVHQAEFYDYETKYWSGSARTIVPAKVPAKVRESVRRMAKEAATALAVEGLGRVDFFLTRSGRLLVNELNAIPGFTAISMYPMLWAAAGVPARELARRLVKGAIARGPA